MPQLHDSTQAEIPSGLRLGAAGGLHTSPEGESLSHSYLCHLCEETVDEVPGRVGVQGILVFADAAGDEIFHASKVPEHSSVRPRYPIKETREDVVHLGTRVREAS